MASNSKLALAKTTLSLLELGAREFDPAVASKVSPLTAIARLVPELGAGLLVYARDKRLRTFLQRVAQSPIFDVEEFRFRYRFHPNQETVRRDFKNMLRALEEADGDEFINPMLHVLVVYLQAETRAAQERVLPVARLIRDLRGSDLQALRILISAGLERSRDDPVVFWHGARLSEGSDFGTVVSTGTTGVHLETLENAPRVFRLLKQADLAHGTSTVLGVYSIDVAFAPGEDNAMAIARDHLNLLRKVFP